DCIQDGSRFGMEVQYSFDGPELLGTGGAIRHALPLLGSYFFVIYGDSYLSCNYLDIWKVFTQDTKPALMTIFRNEGEWDRSNVEFSGGAIRAYSKRFKTPRMRHIDYGIGVFQNAVFRNEEPDAPGDLSLIYERLAASGQLAAFEAEHRFYEIGSLKGIEELSRHLTRCGSVQ
ncbi:MAG: nucleotidyl transferase, partial [Bryobacteraceae bacterium]